MKFQRLPFWTQNKSQGPKTSLNNFFSSFKTILLKLNFEFTSGSKIRIFVVYSEFKGWTRTKSVFSKKSESARRKLTRYTKRTFLGENFFVSSYGRFLARVSKIWEGTFVLWLILGFHEVTWETWATELVRIVQAMIFGSKKILFSLGVGHFSYGLAKYSICRVCTYIWKFTGGLRCITASYFWAQNDQIV